MLQGKYLFEAKMTIEDKVFRKCKLEVSKLKKAGFVKDAENWILKKNFMNDDFCAVIKIDKTGKVSGDVIDVASEEVYLPLRLENNTEGYSVKVRNEYEKILQEIKKSCFKEYCFAGAQTNRMVAFVAEKYGDKPEFPWEKYSDCGVLKNYDSGKWYALVMNIAKNKLDKKSDGNVEIVNMKIDEQKIQQLLKQKGFYPAYHMNKKYWITLALDDSIKDDVLFELLDESHSYTVRKKKNVKSLN